MAHVKAHGAAGLTQPSTPLAIFSSGMRRSRFPSTSITPSRALWLCSLPEFDMHGIAKPKSGSALVKQAGSVAVVEIRRKALFRFRDRFAMARRVVNQLVTPDLSDSKVFGVRMRKIKAAHARAGVHRK